MYLIVFKVYGKWFVEEYHNYALMINRYSNIKEIFKEVGYDICYIKLS